MGFSTRTNAAALATSTAVHTAADETPKSCKAAAANIFKVTVDNSASAADVYVALYDVAVGSVSVGTTEPNLLLLCRAGKKTSYSFRGYTALGTAGGLAFGTALTMAAGTSPAMSAGPTTKPEVTIDFT